MANDEPHDEEAQPKFEPPPSYVSKHTNAQKDAAEAKILESIRDVRYIVREYPIEVVIGKFLKGLDADLNEIFVPDYQRDLVWSEEHQSRLIESVLIGIPIPFLFVADVGESEDPDNAGRLEIIDGVQRIRTLASFLRNELELTDLERLRDLNGYRFFDLTRPRRRRFCRATLRLIELTEGVKEDVRREMFRRINTGSVGLEQVEIRRGLTPGKFLDLVNELADDPRLRKLAPISEIKEARFEYEELTTRFFAFLDKLEEYGTGPNGKVVKKFLQSYVSVMNDQLQDPQEGPKLTLKMRDEWSSMLEFVERHFPGGFAKKGRGRKVPRVRFEAIAVGVGLALREKKDLDVAAIETWLDSQEFKKWTTSDAANNRSNVTGRIGYVFKKLRG